MKYITIILFGALAWNVQAGEIDLSLSQCSQGNGSNTYDSGDCDFISGSYQFDDSVFYVGLGHGKREITMSAYRVWDYTSNEVFGGIKTDINKNFSVFAQAGYVDISNNIDTTGLVAEGISYTLRRTFDPGSKHVFEKASLENSNAFSFEVGMSLSGVISKDMKIGFRFGYKFLKVREVLRVKFKVNNDWIWAVPTNRDLSGPFAGVIIEF